MLKYLIELISDFKTMATQISALLRPRWTSTNKWIV